MQATEMLQTRSTPLTLGDPPPPRAVLDRAFAAAVRAPDHGRLRPWRFVVIDGDARRAFGDVLAAAFRRREPEASPEMVERERAKPMRAPMTIVVAARLTPHPKVPEVEQVLAAGAAAQTLSLALYAEGFATSWKTGAPAYDDSVKQALGLEPGDAIVGFLYAGTPADPGPERPRPAASDYVRYWQPGS